jgi:hypothetical protein
MRITMKNPLRPLLLCTAFIVFVSCGSGEKPEDIISEEERAVPTLEETRFNAQNVFNSLPDRKIVMKLIEENKIEYNGDLLNNPKDVNRYATEFSKAINLGIYGSDLSIASSFDQTQESMVFLKCVNVLAQSLGVNSAFDQRLFERIEANSNNKDSIIEIVTEAFRKVDEILKYNNRPATSAVILSGCWIEGLYVSCNIAMQVDQKNVVKAIVEQRESLRHLIVMLESVKLEENAQFVLDELRTLYDAFGIAESSTEYNKATIARITEIISGLRNRATTTPA